MLCFISRKDLEFWQLPAEFRNYDTWATLYGVTNKAELYLSNQHHLSSVRLNGGPSSALFGNF